MMTTVMDHDASTPPAQRHLYENTRTGLRAACCMLLGTMLWTLPGGARSTNGFPTEPATHAETMSSTLYLAMTRARGRHAEAEYRIDANGHGGNPRHALSLTFTPQGALVGSGRGDLALRLQRFGRGVGTPVRQASPRIEGAWVEYARGDGLREWFVNLPQGVEQGWTITERPRGVGPLVLELDTRRPPDRVGEGRFDWSGLVYHGLAALDARGRRLPARWVHNGTRLRIEVADRAAVYPVVVDPWVQEAKLIASDRAEDDAFGFSVALSGDTALVGAPRAVVKGELDQGAAYVFTRDGETWTEQAKLTPADGSMSDFPLFGISVALSADTALVGAQAAEVDGKTDQGAAYVFTRNGETWTEQAKLTALDGVEGDNFGNAVAIDGDTAWVGSRGVDIGDNLGQGAAYVFVRSDETWSQQAKLFAAGGQAGDLFGWSVALSGDSALVGEWALDEGAAHVFIRNDGGWEEQATLTASDGEAGDAFGRAIALSGDTALVGARAADVDGNVNQGAAYVFRRDGKVWSEQAKLVATDGSTRDRLGESVALSGGTALLGTALDDVGGNNNQGAIYVFTATDGDWSEGAKLTASDGTAEDQFGSPIAISNDTALIGAPGVDSERGAAYVFLDFEPPPDVGTIEGTVQSLGNCQVEATPLEDAIVEITGAESSYTHETRYDGFFRAFLPDVESPLDITVTAPGHLPVTREGITFDGGDIVVQDFDLVVDAPCASAEPVSLSVELEPNHSTTEILTLGNVAGAAELSWTVSTAAPPALDGAPRRRRGSARSHPSDDGTGDPLRRSGDNQGRGAVETASYLGVFSPGVRPLHPATGVVNCDDEPGLILHDDGTIENAYSGDPDSVTSMVWADRFTPSAYPATFDAVCVAFATGGPTSLQFELVVFDDDGPDGAPGTELGALPVSAEGIPGDIDEPVWLSYDISSLDLVIDSGSVYIGPRWAPSDPNVFIAADESTGNPAGFGGGYWWNDDDAVWAPIESVVPEYRSLFVRAVENPGGCLDPTTISWLSLEPISGTTPAGGTSDVEVAIDTTGLTPGAFEASLCIESNDPIHPLLVVPVTLTVTEKDAPELAFDPSSLDFGEVEIGTTSAPQFTTLSNTGNADATGLTATEPGAGFDADTSACSDILAAGQSCEVGVTFTPTEPGPAEAGLSVSSGEGASADLELIGIGVADGGFTPVDLEVDPEPFLADGNGVFEPGELVEVAPAWRNDGAETEPLTGTASNFGGADGAIYFLALEDADYGNVEAGATATCDDTGVCYFLAVDDPAARPATHWEAAFDETLSDDTTQMWSLHIGDSFVDVPRASPFYPAVETLLHHDVTAGCTAADYCPAGANTRGQMAVFLLKAAEGGDHAPPACEAEEEHFADVPFDSPSCPWIEELAERGVTSGCGGGNYCPGDPVTRGQMAVFLLKALEGDGYTPQACTGDFSDVPCPSPFAAWIEELSARGVTEGCGGEPPTYCPAESVTRRQMAVFLTRTFGLQLYGP